MRIKQPQHKFEDTQYGTVFEYNRGYYMRVVPLTDNDGEIILNAIALEYGNHAVFKDSDKIRICYGTFVEEIGKYEE